MKIQPFLLGLALAVSVTVQTANAGWDSVLQSLLGNDASTPSGVGGSASLTDLDISDGLREALAVGAERAVAVLGRHGGYLEDPQVHIPLPGMLRKAAKGLRLVGQQALVDDFETTVNRAAEQAVPETLAIIKATVKGMTLKDVRGILNGGDDSATQYLRKRAGARLQKAVRPIVVSATNRSGATTAYKRLVKELNAGLGGWLDTGSLDLDSYVTEKTLDGLFLKLAAEEREIRHNPVARSTELLKKVFGA